MPSTAQRKWDRNATLALPLLWSFVALLMAFLIPPPSLNHQLAPVYHHSPRTEIDARGEGRTALILTAHPDDEAMFFAPTILGLRNHGWDVKGLCLSTGNAEGLGEIRVEELKRSYEVLGIERESVKVLDETAFTDSMEISWKAEDVQRAVSRYLEEQSVDIIITFDQGGISHHPNHASLAFFRPSPSAENPVMLYHLVTPSWTSKYSGPFNPLFRRGYYQLANGMKDWMNVFDVVPTIHPDFSITSPGLDWMKSVKAMRQHETQMTWYRYGWLLASGMMWANDLKLVV